MEKLRRKEWMLLTDCSLLRLRDSAHNLNEKKTLDEFIEEIKSVINLYLMEAST